MSNVVSFSNQVYPKQVTDKVIDRTFREFGQKDLYKEKTVDQFFRDYEDLYFQIPITGSVNSHQYLVEKSSELYQITRGSSDIQPLLDEITLLKSQSVQDQQTIIELNTKLAELSSAAGN